MKQESVKQNSLIMTWILNTIVSVSHRRVSLGISANGFALGAVAVFGARKCQYTTKADARHKAQLSTKPAIEPNACYRFVLHCQTNKF